MYAPTSGGRACLYEYHITGLAWLRVRVGGLDGLVSACFGASFFAPKMSRALKMGRFSNGV